MPLQMNFGFSDISDLDYSNSYFSGILPMINARPVSPSDVSFIRTLTAKVGSSSVDLGNTAGN
jgi:hypothetical protein